MHLINLNLTDPPVRIVFAYFSIPVRIGSPRGHPGNYIRRDANADHPSRDNDVSTLKSFLDVTVGEILYRVGSGNSHSWGHLVQIVIVHGCDGNTVAEK